MMLLSPRASPMSAARSERKALPIRLEGDMLLMTGIGEWKQVHVQLHDNQLSVMELGEGNPTGVVETVHFRAETRVIIPTRNLRREASYKGCAFQVESSVEMRTFVAPTLADKNQWARKLNMTLADLKTTGRYAFVASSATGTENAQPNSPAAASTPVAARRLKQPSSVDQQLRQRAAVQSLAQSLQPPRTAARTDAADASAPRALNFGGVNVDRSAAIEALERTIAEREQALASKEAELRDALARLQREQQYREQITAGVEKWREDVTKQSNEKLQDTRERLVEEQKRVDVLEAEAKVRKNALQAAESTIATLEGRVRELESELHDTRGLRGELAHLRERLDKELAFVQVLEHDTRQMAEELMVVGEKYEQLKDSYGRDTQALRDQCADLKTQLAAKEDEAMQLKEELGRLRVENKRLRDGEHKMHREFFFSMALSIKLSLAQQGCYSNADLNQLYEQILSVDYSQWHRWLEQALRTSELAVEPEPQTPLGAPARREQPQRSTKKKGWSLFN